MQQRGVRMDPDLWSTAVAELREAGIEATRELADPAAADDSDRPLQRPQGVDNNGMGDVLRFDAERLRLLIERHRMLTGSERARELLEDWGTALSRFVKVMPRDYRRALLAMKEDDDVAGIAAAE